MSKLANFASDMSETNEDIAPQSREILIDVCMMEGTNLPSTIQTSIKFCDVSEPYLHSITLKPGNCTDFKAPFPAVSMDFTFC